MFYFKHNYSSLPISNNVVVLKNKVALTIAHSNIQLCDTFHF